MSADHRDMDVIMILIVAVGNTAAIISVIIIDIMAAPEAEAVPGARAGKTMTPEIKQWLPKHPPGK